MTTATVDGKTKTSHTSVISITDVLSSVTELQDDLLIVQTALNSIDTSPNSELGSKMAILTLSVNSFLINMNTISARVSILEDTLRTLTTVQPATPPPTTSPTFLTVIFTKFTNTWKNL